MDVFEIISKQATESYGDNLVRRIMKLDEELLELKTLTISIITESNNKKIGDIDIINDEQLIDEMSDVVYLINHVSNILGTSIIELLIQAEQKRCYRRFNSTYKK